MSDSLLLNVFLSYTRKDSRKVLYFYNKLNKINWIKPWVDGKNLSTGDDWEYKIQNFIENEAHVVLVFLSQHAVEKIGYFHSEMRKAVEKAQLMPEGEIFILPVRLESCKPPQMLKRYHYEDYFKHTQRSYAKILKVLEGKANKLGIFANTQQSPKILIELLLDIEYANIREARITASRLLGVEKRAIFWNEENRNTRPIRLFVELTERAEFDLRLDLQNKSSEYYSILKYITHKIKKNL